MRPDEARFQDVRAWLSKAELDLKAAVHDISAPDEALWGDVMFHAQQAAEKSMKAFLAWHDVPFRKTHNLEELGQQCMSVDAILAPVADQAAPLSDTRGSSATLVKRPNLTVRRRKPHSRQRGTCTTRSWRHCRKRRDHEPAPRRAARVFPFNSRPVG